MPEGMLRPCNKNVLKGENPAYTVSLKLPIIEF
jgi:hypothetical protein